jgi:hypothetical protein
MVRDGSGRVLVLALVVASMPAAGFDGDTSINHVNLRQENWLDLSAYGFRKSLDQQWNQGDNGLRFTGGSLNADHLFLHTELRYRQPLSEQVDMRLGWREERFYAVKPFEHPYAEVAWHPDGLPLEFSFLGRSGYAKSGADFGGAVSLGRRPWDYLRLVYFTEESLYNQKNDDASRYESAPKTVRLEGALRLFDERIVTRFALERNTPLELVEADGTTTFRHNGSEIRGFIDYRPTRGQLYGLGYRGFRQEKSIDTTSSSRGQDLRYDSVRLYWQYTALSDYEINAGIRADRLRNSLRDSEEPDSAYRIATPQVYGVLTHWYTRHQAWELGTFVGRTRETTDYRDPAEPDDEERSIQGKLRTSWEYRSADGRSTLMLHFTFNLDELAEDPGDGAGMTYQGVF